MDDLTPQEEGENLEDVSPSFKGGKPKKPAAPKKAAGKAEDMGKKAGEKAVKKGTRQLAKQVALAIGRAIAHAVTTAVSALAAAVGWPVLVGCLVVFLIIMIIFGGLMCLSINGYFGSTLPQPAGKNDSNVKELIAATGQKVLDNPSGKHYKLEFLNKRDLEYLQSGQIDKRLAAALNYLVKKHDLIRVSHIVSGYEDMKIDPESGAFHDIQITKNISAHKRGEAADIDEIDGVKEQCKCGSTIPVKVAWQAIGENPFGTAPDALKNIQKASDLAQDKIKNALKELGVQGLDQPDIEAKLQTISGITSVYDLTNPQVIDALAAIGVIGIDNPDLQKGLKRLQALQGIYDLSPQDLNALTSGQGADLLSQLGIQITPEVRATIEKYQQAQALETIRSVEDLARPEVQAALQSVGIDPNDPAFKTSLEKILAAKTITQWDGNVSDENLQKALQTLYPAAGQEFQEALELYQGYKNGLETPPGHVITNLATLTALEQAGISPDNPTAQDIFSNLRAFAQITNPDEGFTSSLKGSALAYVGLTLTEQNKDLFEKYQAAQYIIDFKGSLDDPELQASMAKLGVGADKLDLIRQADAVTALIKNTNLKDLFPADFQKLQDIQTILNVKNLADLQNPNVRTALESFNINLPEYYDDIVGYASIIDLLRQGSTADIVSAAGQVILANLDIPPEIAQHLGQLSDIATLANIHNPMDLTKPEVQAALQGLGIDTGQLGQVLGKVGDINALMSIRSPEDLLKPSTLKALGDLGIIDVDSELLGQIGSVQTLLQVRSIGDIFNPNTVLALNNLGIIALSNPVVAALTAVVFLDQFFGLGLFSCKGSTDCYKPTAQNNVHTVISELLQFPYDLGNPDYYRVTQLITYSEERDVLPFQDQLDKLYGRGRPNNYGLFAMPEAHDHLHIGY